jgi:hypothetical protein
MIPLFPSFYLAVDHDPESRPKLTTMFIVLSNCFESFLSHTPSITKYTTHAEAAKKHEMFDLITKIRDLLDKIGEITQAAEHNKRICKVLKQRVYVVYLAILDFKVQRGDKEYLNENNHQCLQNLVAVITKIKEFVTEISQMTTLLKLNYNQPKNIEKKFKELCKDFDNTIGEYLSNFTTKIKNKINLEEEAKALKADQDELNKVSL